MKYEETEEYLSGLDVPSKNHDDANRCGYYNTEDGTYMIGYGDDIEWSSCNLKYGCRICGINTVCSTCGEDHGVVNSVGGVDFRDC